MSSLLLEYCKSLKNGCGRSSWHKSLYPLLMTLPEKRRKAKMGRTWRWQWRGAWGNGEMWRLRMKRRKAVMRGAGRKVEKRKNASLRENFDYNAGS